MKFNPMDLPWVVHKYGGTSIGKCLETIADIILPDAFQKHKVVIVCSAQSRDTKENGTTSQLLQAAELALIEGSKGYLDLVQSIRFEHLQTARQCIKNPEVLTTLEIRLEKECLKLRSFLKAAEVINEVSPRSRDILASMGELLSSFIVQAVLEDRGIESQQVILNHIIQQEFTTLDQSFYDYVSQEIKKAIEGCEHRIPVVTGFFGNVPGSLLNTIGRGYTDLCAALTAIGLEAQELQIWKEVDGVFTADPEQVPSARLLHWITPEEAAELSDHGSEVVHPFTMEQVVRAHIPIRIRNIHRPQGPGSVIATTPRPEPGQLSPTAITVKNKIYVLNVRSNRKTAGPGFLAHVFTVMDDHLIKVDLISTSQMHISMALSAHTTHICLEKAMVDLERLGHVQLVQNMAIVSLVGRQMKKMKSVAGDMFTSLAETNISIEVISQSASEISISCVVKQEQAVAAVKAIHQRLLDIHL
ncbi:Aspartate/glutamate/uridylate kinase [Sporodiniella umbellata]|nr:Aspartate/glutamate/uridylate kinase [Sporodiniella umbellata]